MNGMLMAIRACSRKIIDGATPGWSAFFGSILLSLIARSSSLINRDGMLYVDTARVFLEAGFTSARETFAWPFLSIVMACVSQLTGLSLENAGYLLNSLFMAGACALLVTTAGRRFPDAAWSICLVTLALPGLNEYRNELLREFGCWYFIMQAFWLALRWSENPRWLTVLAVHVSIGAATLFRPEALAMFPALFFWQLFAAPREQKWQRLMMITAPPLFGLIVLLAFYFGGQIPSENRLAGDLARFSSERFNATAQAFAATLPEYAQNQASTILFFGSLAIIPIKFACKIGIFFFPLLFFFIDRHARTAIARLPLFAWGFLAHLLILGVFVIDLQFLAGRYVGLLYLFSAPFVGIGLRQLMQRYSRCHKVIILITLLIMVTNVVSLSSGKNQYVKAGNWLAKNVTESQRIYIESARAAYYAGWRFSGRPAPQERPLLPEELANGRYDLVVLEISRKETSVADWLASAGLREIKRFSHPNGDAVIVAEPLNVKNQDSDSKTERIRKKTGVME